MARSLLICFTDARHFEPQKYLVPCSVAREVGLEELIRPRERVIRRVEDWRRGWQNLEACVCWKGLCYKKYLSMWLHTDENTEVLNIVQEKENMPTAHFAWVHGSTI